jgi:hypothetical protein
MLRILRKTVIVILTGLCLASAVALAAEDTLSGTVQNVDPRQGRLIVSVQKDHVVELRAPTELLTGLQVGDVVEVRRSGQQATEIRRQEGEQRPAIGGTLRFYPEGEMPQ